MAGMWNERVIRGLGPNRAERSMFSVVREFTADADDASVPNWELLDINPAFLADIGIVFDVTTAPSDTLELIIEDIDGLIVAQETFSASGRVVLSDRPSVIGGCTISVNGNTVDEAKAKIILNFANNLR